MYAVEWSDIGPTHQLESAHGARTSYTLAIQLKRPLVAGKRELSTLVLSDRDTAKVDVKLNEDKTLPTGLHQKLQGARYDVIGQLIGAFSGVQVSPIPTTLRPIKCYYNVDEGQVFLLDDCLLFFMKPYIYIHADEIAAIHSARCASAQTRTGDIEVETEDGSSVQFRSAS